MTLCACVSIRLCACQAAHMCPDRLRPHLCHACPAVSSNTSGVWPWHLFTCGCVSEDSCHSPVTSLISCTSLPSQTLRSIRAHPPPLSACVMMCDEGLLTHFWLGPVRGPTLLQYLKTYTVPFTILVMTYRALRGQAPSYIQDLVKTHFIKSDDRLPDEH